MESRNYSALVTATEQATGTRITLDETTGCVSSFENVGGDDYAELQAAFGEIVADEDNVFAVVLAVTEPRPFGIGSSSFTDVASPAGDPRRWFQARIATSDLGLAYPCGGGSGWVGPQLIAHELVGHAKDVLENGWNPRNENARRRAQATAISYENSWNRNFQRAERC